MLKGFVIGIVATIAAIVAAGYLVVASGSVPANADARPPKLEAWAARTSLRAALGSQRSVQNPLPATDDNLLAGMKLYAQNCAVCHGGAAGKATNIAKGLYQHPPQLAEDGVEDDPPGVTYWKVYHGIRWTGMPAFGHTLTQNQLWQLTLFLNKMDHLPPKVNAAWRQVKS